MELDNGQDGDEDEDLRAFDQAGDALMTKRSEIPMLRRSRPRQLE